MFSGKSRYFINSIMSYWRYKGEIIKKTEMEQHHSFIYVIENTTNGRKYIGKKTIFFQKTRQVKGKKKKTKVLSDYADYWGSSPELLADIKKLGKSKFTREILHFCNGKGEANYLELREQIDRRVLESDEYYNSWISIKVSKDHIKNLSS